MSSEKQKRNLRGLPVSHYVCMTCEKKYGVEDSMFPRPHDEKYDDEKDYVCPRCKSGDVKVIVDRGPA